LAQLNRIRIKSRLSLIINNTAKFLGKFLQF